MKRSEAVAEGRAGAGGGRRGTEFAVQKRSMGLRQEGFAAASKGRGRGWTEGSVSALRLPDAPNIMFNDINFLLNGPRFDSRCERGTSPLRTTTRRSWKKYTRENNLASREV